MLTAWLHCIQPCKCKGTDTNGLGNQVFRWLVSTKEKRRSEISGRDLQKPFRELKTVNSLQDDKYKVTIIEISTKDILTNVSSTTEPIQHHIGSVVELMFNKSVIPRILTVGPDNLALYSSIQPQHYTPFFRSYSDACFCKHWKVIHHIFSQVGIKLVSGILPCTRCLFNVSSTTEPIQRRIGSVVELIFNSCWGCMGDAVQKLATIPDLAAGFIQTRVPTSALLT